MWIPPQTTVPPGARARSATGTSAPSGAKTIAASSGSGGASSEPPAHTAPSSRANACAGLVAGTGDREHASPLPARHLAEDVRRGAEPVEAETGAVAAHPQGAEADQAGTQQRGGLEVRVPVRQGEAEPLVGDRVLRHPAVEVAAGEAGTLAEVLAT